MALFMNRGCHREWSDAGRYLLASGRIVSVSLWYQSLLKLVRDTNADFLAFSLSWEFAGEKVHLSMNLTG